MVGLSGDGRTGARVGTTGLRSTPGRAGRLRPPVPHRARPNSLLKDPAPRPPDPLRWSSGETPDVPRPSLFLSETPPSTSLSVHNL